MCGMTPASAPGTTCGSRFSFFLRGLDGARLHHHLDLVFGAREQLDGPGLAEPGSVHLEEDGPLVGLDPQGDGDVDDRRDAVHCPGFLCSVLGPVEAEEAADDAAVMLRRDREGPESRGTLHGFRLPLSK